MNGPFTGDVLPRVDAPWLVLLPLVGVLVAAALARWPRHRAARVLPWVVTFAPAAALALAPAGGLLHAHGATLLRLGFLEVRLDGAVDRSAALLALAVAVAGALRPSPRAAWIVALALGVLVVDDRLVAALGWCALVALATQVRALLVAALAPVAVVLLFWGLGGGYTSEGYVPNLGPRVVAVVAGDAKPVPESVFDDDDDDEIGVPEYAAGDHGTLAVRALPGAALHLDGARAPTARSPIEGRSLPAGFHAFRLHPGQAYDDYVVAQLRVDPGQRVVLVTAGSTTSAADARDAMQARLGESAPFAEALAARRVLGTSLVLVVAGLFAVAGLAALRSLVPALTLLGLVAALVAVAGASPPAALIAFALALAAAFVSPRADALLAVGAALAGAPLPAALALAATGALPERRAAAVASFVPRAAVVATLSGDASTAGRLGLAVFLAASIGGLVAPRVGGAGASSARAGWVAAFLVALVGAASFALARPSVVSLVVAGAVTLAGIVPAPAWARGRRGRIARLVRGRRALADGLRRVAGTLGALEGNA